MDKGGFKGKKKQFWQRKPKSEFWKFKFLWKGKGPFPKQNNFHQGKGFAQKGQTFNPNNSQYQGGKGINNSQVGKGAQHGNYEGKGGKMAPPMVL